MNYHILTLFPEMVTQGLSESILGRAAKKGLLSVNAVNIRDYTADRHKKVDDYPYGGGAGMLMQAQPVYDAWKAACEEIRSRQPEELRDRPVRTVYVTQNQQVKKGDVLIEFDPAAIKAEGYQIVTPILVCNPDAFTVEPAAGGTVTAGDALLTLKKK